ncbi:hypothetical protein [Brassicibacter mesophilus]|uniref:hypothetical protein n=1 Tax=Brassicibacter mesophilus TaxID=745119 RepID=UPI003D1C8A55
MKDKELLEVIDWMDQKRWESSVNYNIIENEIFSELTDDQRILVHWISYITDRQMPFEKIWIHGGYVFSGIANEYINNDLPYVDLKNYINIWKEEGKHKVKFVYKDREFASRFISTDLKSILLTFRILLDHSNNIVKYVNDLFSKYYYLADKYEKQEANNLNLVAFILHLLSYEFVKLGSKTNIEDYFSEVESYYNKYKDIITNEAKFERYYKTFIKRRLEGKKRVWCCVRDYTKSKEFNNYFANSLKEIHNNQPLLDIFQDEKQYYYLELPGDVWNLRAEFVENLIKNNLNINSKNIPKELRKNLKYPYYPELFDLTFDFVPRMCSSATNAINRTMCNICFFGDNGMLDYCHSNTELNCPILMISCGYSVKCNPINCPVKEKVGIGLCKGI